MVQQYRQDTPTGDSKITYVFYNKHTLKTGIRIRIYKNQISVPLKIFDNHLMLPRHSIESILNSTSDRLPELPRSQAFLS